MNRMPSVDDHVELGEGPTRRFAAEDFTLDTARDGEAALANTGATSAP